MDVLTISQNVFGSSFETTKRSSITKIAISSELIVPDLAVELSYEEMEYVKGGGRISLGITFSLGAVVGASVVSSVIGYLTGYSITKAIKFGTMIGGFWGGVAGLLIGGLVSFGIKEAVNNVVYPGASGPKEITLIDINTGVFGPSINYHFDLGNLLGIVIGFGGGFGAGYLAGSARALAPA